MGGHGKALRLRAANILRVLVDSGVGICARVSFTQTAVDDHSRFPKDSSSQEKHYDYDQLTSVSILLALLLNMNILYSEVVHPRGPADGG